MAKASDLMPDRSRYPKRIDGSDWYYWISSSKEGGEPQINLVNRATADEFAAPLTSLYWMGQQLKNRLERGDCFSCRYNDLKRRRDELGKIPDLQEKG